ncbi:MAG: hypothetical protein OEY50_02325 [Nitrospinota bacterium]|nr:hypothetical protein [Nitrospinota bacterium]
MRSVINRRSVSQAILQVAGFLLALYACVIVAYLAHGPIRLDMARFLPLEEPSIIDIGDLRKPIMIVVALAIIYAAAHALRARVEESPAERFSMKSAARRNGERFITIAALALGAHLFFTALFPAFWMLATRYHDMEKHMGAIHAAALRVPPGASVLASAAPYYEGFAEDLKADLLFSPEARKDTGSYDYIAIDAKMEPYLLEKEVRPLMLDRRYCAAYASDSVFLFKRQTGTRDEADQCKEKDLPLFNSHFLSFEAVNLPFAFGVDFRLYPYSPRIVRAAFADATPPGYMLYGPYIHLDPGKYMARFLVKFDNGSQGGSIHLDVAARKGSVILGRLSAQAGEYYNHGRWQWVEFPFTIEEENMDDVEARVYHDGKADVFIQEVSIRMSPATFLGMQR